MSQVKVTALIEPTPIWTTVLQPVTIIMRQHYSSNCNFDTHKFVDYNSIIGPISPLSSSNLRNNNLLSFVLIKRIMSKNPKYFIRFLVVFNIFRLKSVPTSISPNTVNSFALIVCARKYTSGGKTFSYFYCYASQVAPEL
jgi:hypothetical protein